MLTLPTETDKGLELAALKAECARLGITQERIAQAAKVTRPLVVNVFAGRSVSRNVVETAKRLVARAHRRGAKRQSNGTGTERAPRRVHAAMP